jgi:dethiobiotin synthase
MRMHGMGKAIQCPGGACRREVVTCGLVIEQRTFITSESMNAKKIIFVTGTDTGVGKTVLTALLLHYLRKNGARALAMKPFCSGGKADVKLLQALQPGELSDEEVNPFYFEEPVAPLVAAQKHRRNIRLEDVMNRIQSVAKQCDYLLVEGVGGLLAPWGKGYNAVDLIAQLNCRVIVVARNQLGTINHTLLTTHALQSLGKTKNRCAIVLMSGKTTDLSAASNRKTLIKLLRPLRVLDIPFLGDRAARVQRIKQGHAKAIKTLGLLAKSSF